MNRLSILNRRLGRIQLQQWPKINSTSQTNLRIIRSNFPSFSSIIDDSNVTYKGEPAEEKSIESKDHSSEFLASNSEPYQPALTYDTVPKCPKFRDMSPEQAYEAFLDISKDPSNQLTIKEFNSLLNALKKQKNLLGAQRMEQVFKYIAKLDYVEPDVATYNSMIHAFGGIQDVKAAIAYFNKMKTAKVQPTSITYNTLISIFTMNKQVKAIPHLLEEMKLDGVQPDSFTYSTLIHAYSFDKDLDRVLQVEKEMKASGIYLDVVIYNALIKACGNAKALDKALELFQQMKDEGHTPDLATYNSLIRVCRRCSKRKLSRTLFDELLMANIEPNHTTLHEANLDPLVVLDKMKDAGITPSGRTYETFINTTVKKNDFATAYKIFRRMTSSGVAPTVYSYAILIDALVKSGDISEAVQLSKDMQASGLQPDVVIYTTLIDGMAAMSNTKGTLELFEDMISSGVQPNAYTFNNLLSACGKSSDWNQAIKLFESMGSHGVRPDVRTYNSLFAAYNEEINPTYVWDLYKEMESKRIKPDRLTYVLLTKIFAASNHTKHAMKVYIDMQDSGNKPSLDIFNKLMDMNLAFNDDMAIFRLWSDMSTLKVVPDITTVGILLKAWDREGHLSAAVTNMHLLVKKKFHFTPNLWITYISILTKHGLFDEVVKLLPLFRKNEVFPNHRVLEAVKRSLEFSGDTELLSEALALIDKYKWIRDTKKPE